MKPALFLVLFAAAGLVLFAPNAMLAPHPAQAQATAAPTMPTMTAEPLAAAAVTAPMAMADSLTDGVAVDSAIMNGDNFASDFAYLCGNWFGRFRCIRHARDGFLATTAANTQADYNLLGSYGIGLTYQTNANDPSSLLAASYPLFNNVEYVLPSNEVDAPNYGAKINFVYNAGTTSMQISLLGGFPFAGPIYVGEGPNREQTTITGYTTVNVIAIAPALVNNHPTNLTTTLAASYTAASPAVVTYLPAYQATPPYATAAPYPATTAAPSAVTSITVANASGMTVGDWITLNCGAVNSNSGAKNIEETAITAIAGNALTIAPGLRYSHSANENVTEGCVRRVPDNIFGAAGDVNAETNRLALALPGARILAPSFAFAQDANIFWPAYGGTPLTYSSFSAIQGHDYTQINPGGQWGDGTTGFGPVHPYCFGNNCANGSWQWDMSGMLAEGGSTKPKFDTEEGFPIVPVGAVYNTGNGSAGQIPDDVAVAWVTRGPLYRLMHGYARDYFFRLLDGGGGFCTYGLVRTTNCSPYNIGAGTQPKGAYKALTDLDAFFADSCRTPGCSFVPDPLTWGWTALPAAAHGATPATDPSQVRSHCFEYSTGAVACAYWYEATDYNEFVGNTGCGTTTACYQWGGNPANTSPDGGQYALYASSLYITGAQRWSGCVKYAFDDLSTDPTFGNLLPKAGVRFNASDQLALTFTALPQIVYCANTGFHPTPSGVAAASPAPIGTATSDPTPVWAVATAVPTLVPTAAPSTSPIALVQPCAFAQNSGSATSATATLTSAVTVGHALVAGFAAANTGSQVLSAPASFTAVVKQGPAPLLTVWSQLAQTTTSSFTFAQTVPGPNALIVCELANATALAAASVGSASNVSSLSLPSLTPATAQSLPLAFFALDRYPTLAAGAGWTPGRYAGAPYRVSLEVQTAGLTTLAPVSAMVSLARASANVVGAQMLVAP